MLQESRFALRTLTRNPGFTAVGVLTLALWIGANTAVFTLINAVILQPFPADDPARLVSIFTTDRRNPGKPAGLASQRQAARHVETR
jgi:hypothetical protein